MVFEVIHKQDPSILSTPKQVRIDFITNRNHFKYGLPQSGSKFNDARLSRANQGKS